MVVGTVSVMAEEAYFTSSEGDAGAIELGSGWSCPWGGARAVGAAGGRGQEPGGLGKLREGRRPLQGPWQWSFWRAGLGSSSCP